MFLYASKNSHFANQGKKIANNYAALVTECIERDRVLAQEFAGFNNGKWKGMELAEHIGFVKWNDSNCRYPLRVQVEPADKPRLVVSRKDNDEICVKTYGNPETIFVDDFLYAGNNEVFLEIANDGKGFLDYVIEVKNLSSLPEWLELSAMKGSVEFQDEIILRCNREKLNESYADKTQNVRLLIKSSDTVVAVEIQAKAIKTNNKPPMTFLENNGVIVINSNHFCEKKDVNGAGFLELINYGRSGCGMKVFPTTLDFNESYEKPGLTYQFLIEENGSYNIEVWTTPTNSVKKNRPLRFMLCSNDVKHVITAIPADFNGGDHTDKVWAKGVLDNIRVSEADFSFDKGIQTITISALEAGLVLERILIYRPENKPMLSYLGPPESFYVS